MSSIVIKVGGNILESDDLYAVASDVAALTGRGDRVVLIHGGGPQATAVQKQLGQTPNIVAGRRITDQAALDVMKMVVGGRLNIDLCAALVAARARPIGLNGSSSRAIAGTRRPPRVVSGGGEQPIDFGLVGDVTGINRPLLNLVLDAGYTPVLACLAADESGRVLNINADVVANRVAVEFAAAHLILVTGTPGVLRDIDDPASRIARLTAAQARKAISDGTVSGGMIPKLDESIAVVAGGQVGSIHIVGKLSPGDLLREIDEPGAVGTALLP
ncbi:MAG: acetylglutamate kinase [Proteobacteria bacterium]|nr:acetylglutamate kinase [Pseudomonadota bacterium]